MTLQEVIHELVKKHGSLVQLGRAAGVSPNYLCRLRSGQAKAPSDRTMNKLGIRRVDQYERVPPK